MGKRLASAMLCAAGISCAAPVYAQEKADTPQSKPSEAEAGDIIVTAQKRAQGLQDVPLAVSAIGGDLIGPSGTNDVSGLGSIVPNVSVGTQFGIAQIFIRGVGLDNVFVGADPSVAMHVDGAVISQSINQLGSFFDLERVEVLRGPQGTLYGRNSTGGVINLITRKPSNDLSGYIRMTYGNYDQIVGEAAVGGPITNGVQARLAIRTEDRSGFGRNPRIGTDVDDANKRSIRALVNFDLGPDVTFLVSGELHHEDDAAYGLHFKEVSFPSQPVGSPLYGLGQGGYAADIRDIASEGPIRNKRQTWSVTGTLDAKLNELLSLKSITNYRKFYNNPLQDLDASAVQNPTRQNNYSRGHQFSQELQLSLATDRLNALVSAFYFDEYLFGDNRIGLNPGIDVAPGQQSVRVRFMGDVNIQSAAVFGQATYELTDQISLTAGARYTHEKRTGDSTTINPGGTFLSSPGGSFDNFSPRLSVEWRPIRGVLAFGTYSKGFKSGIILAGQLNPILRPETVENWEGGLKTTLLGNMLTFNLTAFRSTFTDLQVGKSVPSASGTSINTIFENAASAKTWGLELETTLRPAKGLSLTAAGGYLDAKFDDYSSSNPLELDQTPPSPVRSLKGNRLVQAPEWTLNLRGNYVADLPSGGDVTFSADVDYKSKIYFTPFNDERASQNGRTVVNGSITYRMPSNISISVWAKNLFDKTFYSTNYVIATSRLILATYAPPRTYGITAGLEF